MEKDKLTNQNKYDTLEIKDIDKKSSLLTGKDILPCPYDKRTVTPNKLIAIWFAMAIEVTIFMSAAQLYQMIPVWEVRSRVIRERSMHMWKRKELWTRLFYIRT